jgi:outer membrane protein assembly factor BamA
MTGAKNIVLLFFLFAQGTLLAQTDSTRTDSSRGLEIIRSDSTKKSDHGIVGAPFVQFAPETGFAFGAAGLYYFHIDTDTIEGKANRTSSISFGGNYTQMHQLSTGMDYTLNFLHDRFYVYGGLDYKRYPFKYFGIGDHNPKDPIDNYTPFWWGGDLLATTNVISTPTGEGLNVGIATLSRKDIIVSSTKGGVLDTGNVPGKKGGTSTGVGIITVYDTRDNVFSTLNGQYVDFRTMFYSKAFGSSFNFIKLTLDTRTFIPAFTGHIIALQGLLTLTNGGEPFYTMAQLGGENNMRGYFQGRFRDNDMAVVQGEYRLPVFWRFGLVGFADIGEVAGTVKEFSLPGIRWTAGGGIRFLFSRTEHIVICFDVGFGSDCSAVYFYVKEAF